MNAVLQQYDVEVDQQPDRKVQQTEVRKKLRAVDWMQRFFALQFDYHQSIHQQVRTEAAFKLDRLIEQRHRLLLLYLHTRSL